MVNAMSGCKLSMVLSYNLVNVVTCFIPQTMYSLLYAIVEGCPMKSYWDKSVVHLLLKPVSMRNEFVVCAELFLVVQVLESTHCFSRPTPQTRTRRHLTLRLLVCFTYTSWQAVITHPSLHPFNVSIVTSARCHTFTCMCTCTHTYTHRRARKPTNMYTL